jgi:hypothetical protein
MIGLVFGGFLLTANRYENAVNLNQPTIPMVQPAMSRAVAVPFPAQEKAVVVPGPAGETPTPTPVLPPAEKVALSEEEQGQVYAAIVLQMYSVDHTFGDKPPNWQKVYLVTQTDDGVGDPSAVQSEPVVLSKDILSEITNQLTDFPAQILPVDSRDSVPMDEKNGAVDKGQGVIFTLGNIHPAEDGTLHVSASLYFRSLGAAGKTYILTKVDGVWKITGTTGVEWIS